jgi:hypothetical protein
LLKIYETKEKPLSSRPVLGAATPELGLLHIGAAFFCFGGGRI